MQKILIIINDAPYGTEKAYNALRMAMTLQKEHSEKMEVKSCGGCSEARGIEKIPFVRGVQLSNMKEFSQWTMECDKVITF